jgi:hypothetical protein
LDDPAVDLPPPRPPVIITLPRQGSRHSPLHPGQCSAAGARAACTPATPRGSRAHRPTAPQQPPHCLLCKGCVRCTAPEYVLGGALPQARDAKSAMHSARYTVIAQCTVHGDCIVHSAVQCSAVTAQCRADQAVPGMRPAVIIAPGAGATWLMHHGLHMMCP